MFRTKNLLAPALAALFLAVSACEPAETEPDLPGILIEDAGFQTPESVQHDPIADVYLVSNINGGPLDEAGNGFISRLSPEGEVLDLKWIDGEAEGVILNAPKGIAILEDVIWVADIDHVRGFDRETGEPVDEIFIEGSTFLNGLAIDPARGILYVSDTGMTLLDGEFVPMDTDAVYQIDPDGTVSTLVQGGHLGGPNGLTYSDRGLIVAAFLSGQLYAVQPGGEIFEMMPASERQLDGLVALPDRGFLVSDWNESLIIRINPDGTMAVQLPNVEAPADIGFDQSRNRLLIPLFMDDAVLLVDIEVEAPMAP